MTTGTIQHPPLEHRILTLVAALALFGAAFSTWSTIVQVPATGAVSVIATAGTLVVVVMTMATTSERVLDRLDLAALVLALLLLAGWSTSTLFFQPAYGTDEGAFVQYGASLLLHGHNPYAANLLPALNEFHVPIQYATYTLGGHVVSGMPYPALPVLLVAVFVIITHGVQSVVVANVVALAASVLILFLGLPKRWRALAVLMVLGFPLLFAFAIAGLSAILMMPFLLVVAHRWATVGSKGRFGRGDYARAVCFGLALAVQQLSWLIAPFLLTGMYLIRRGASGKRDAVTVVARYAGIGLLVFLVVDAPFIVWNPAAWAVRVMSPLTQHAIAYGQGVVDASLFFRIGGGDLRLYTVVGALVYAALLGIFAVSFRRLGRAAFVLPSVALFFPARSLAEYWIALLAIWVMSAITVRHEDLANAVEVAWPLRAFSWAGDHARSVMTVGAFVPAAGVLALAMATPQPLAMRVTDLKTNGELQSVWRITVAVTNTSGTPLVPHFAANYVGQPTTFWNVLEGPGRLAPHGSAVYTLTAPNLGSMPGIVTPFVLTAVTARPESISVTRLITPQPYTATITPSYVDAVQPPGGQLTLQVQLRSPFGGVVHASGVRVALGQTIYDQAGLIPAEARINGAAEGATPVFSTTGSNGVATFHVADSSPQGRPVYFQAWIQARGGYPYGYSSIVPVLWRGDAGKLGPWTVTSTVPRG
ncbi:MAG: hypothetical protein ACYCYA_13070 [Actinomycetes bacterium]